MTVKKFIPYLEKMREAVGPDFDLALEKRPWSLEESLTLAPVLEDHEFKWFEEPMSLSGEDAIENHLKFKRGTSDSYDIRCGKNV